MTVTVTQHVHFRTLITHMSDITARLVGDAWWDVSQAYELFYDETCAEIDTIEREMTENFWDIWDISTANTFGLAW